MKNAIGNALLFNIVVSVLVITMAFLASSLSYSKAYKVKNNIVNSIEKNEGFNKDEINSMLSSIGYRVIKGKATVCSDKRGNGKLLTTNTQGNYRYCIFEYTSGRGKFYAVTSYMYFDLPLIENLLEFPIYGETKVFLDTSRLEG